MLKPALRSLITLALCPIVSSAQAQSTPPPWFELETPQQTQNINQQQDDALPKITEFSENQRTIRNNQNSDETNSTLEELYSNRINQPLKQFGYDLFNVDRLENVSNAPIGAVQDTYILGTGDELQITFTGQRNDQVLTKIDPNGLIIIQDFTPIPAAGRTIKDLRNALESQTANLPNTKSYISLSKIRQIGVLVIGNVKTPGRKSLNTFNTVFDAIRSAGGIQKQGSLRHIKLVRGGLSTPIDLYDLLTDGSPGQDIQLKDGDRIVIPPIGPTIAVAGAVKRPGIYELKKTKLGHTQGIGLEPLLAMAGGVLSAGQNRLMKHTPTQSGHETITEIPRFSGQYFHQSNILNVLRGTDAQKGFIELIGHTKRPGKYDQRNYRNLSQLLQIPAVMDDDIYPLIGIIERKDKSTLSTKKITFSVRSVFKKEKDIALNENDKVILLSNQKILALLNQNATEKKQTKDTKKSFLNTSENIEIDPTLKPFLKEQSVQLRGAVRQTGLYPITKGTKLQSLLAAAGGMTLNANLKSIEITSHKNRDNGSIRETFSIDPNDDNYTPALAITLSPGDSVRVNQSKKQAKDNAVLIIGEVQHPGKYDLLPGDKISTLIERAGGLSDQAYPAGAIFSRESERRREELRYRSTAQDLERRLAQTIESDKKNKPNETQIEMVRDLADELSTTQAVGRITIESDPDVLLLNPELDMYLEKGDKLYVPKRPLTVRVAGEVFSPAALQFRRDKDPRDYINEAGGFTKAADKKRTFVLYPDGSAHPLKVSAWNHTPIFIPPGATIVVPLDPKPFNFLNSAKEIGQIIGNLAITAVFIDDIRD